MTRRVDTVIENHFENKRTAIWITVIAIASSLMFSFLVFPHIKVPLNLNPDPDKCGELASNIAEGKGYVYDDSPQPVIDRGPVYPYLVAIMFFISDDESIRIVQVFQALCHGATVFMVFVIAARLFGRQAGVGASFVCAIHPMLIWYTARLWIETVHSLVVVLVAWSVIHLFAGPSYRRAFAAGLAIGIASLTKSVLLLSPLMIGIVLAVRFGRKEISRALLLAMTTLVVVAPWTLRNHHVTGMLVPVHTSLGLNLIQGDAIGAYWIESPYSTIEIWHKGTAWTDSLLAGTGQTAVDPVGDRLLVASSMGYNFSNPLHFLKKICTNAFTFWYLSESSLKSAFLFIIQIPLAVLVFVCGRRLWRNTPDIRPVLLLIAYYVSVHALVVGWARYSAPIVSLSVVVVIGGLQPVIERWKNGGITRARSGNDVPRSRE